MYTRTGGLQVALEQVYPIHTSRTQVADLRVFQGGADLLLIGGGDILPDAADGQVRGKLTVFRMRIPNGPQQPRGRAANK